jgi:hypothetical protein
VRIEDARLLPHTRHTRALWLVRIDSPDGAPRPRALAGTAELDPNGSIELTGTVPEASATVEGVDVPKGTVSPLEPGRYQVSFDPSLPSVEAAEGSGLAGVVFTVTATGRGLAPPAAGDHLVVPAYAVLRADELAGVRLGIDAAGAMVALERRFGRPDSDTGWTEGCVGGRTVTWGGLRAWFTGRTASEATLAWYLYEGSSGPSAEL